MRARKRRPLFRDPTPRYVGRDEFDGALRELDSELVEVLAAYVYGVAPSRLARRMDTAVGYGVQFLVVHALTAIRDSPQAESLREELRADHGPRYSRALRAAAQRMEVDGAPRCRQCAAPLASGAPTGRPRQYCGNACRQTAYRRRMRDRTYDATTESVYRRGLTPPPPEQKPVPLPPLKPPRHGYRLGDPGYDEYLARLLDKWASPSSRKDSEDRSVDISDWLSRREYPEQVERTARHRTPGHVPSAIRFGRPKHGQNDTLHPHDTGVVIIGTGFGGSLAEYLNSASRSAAPPCAFARKRPVPQPIGDLGSTQDYAELGDGPASPWLTGKDTAVDLDRKEFRISLTGYLSEIDPRPCAPVAQNFLLSRSRQAESPALLSTDSDTPYWLLAQRHPARRTVHRILPPHPPVRRRISHRGY